MIKSYFKVIVKNLWKNKLYTSINIVCLSIGIAALVWGIQTYRFSFSFDNFHKETNRVYRVLTKIDGSDELKGISPAPVAAFAKQDLASVQQAVKLDSRWLDIKADQTEAFSSRVHFTDNSFFNVFNFPVVKGHVNLDDKSAVAITEQAAKKYFGNGDPIGKTLLLYSAAPFKISLTVTAVLKDVPTASTIRFDIITSFENLLKDDGKKVMPDEWAWFSNAVFLKVPVNTDISRLEKDLQKYVPIMQEARKDIKVTAFKVETMQSLALKADVLGSNALFERPSNAAAFGPLVLAILVLFSACLNFANTSISQSNRRLKEMGIRKVMGSSRSQIVLQQLLECAFVVLIAIGLSVLINNWWLPEFNSMFEFVKITTDYSDTNLLLVLAAILVGVTLMAGGYPAFYISRFNASSIFRGSIKFGGRNLFSRVLLGFQIVISFITVIAGLAFSKNATFQKNYDYGYNKDNVVGFYVAENDFSALRNEIINVPGIESIAGTRQNLGFWQRTVSLEAAQQKTESQFIETGENYLTTMQLKLVAGRDFNSDGKGDIGHSLIINQKLAARLGWNEKEAIGKQVKVDTSFSTVIGVIKDFSSGNFFMPKENFAIAQTEPARYTQLIIRAKPAAVVSVHDQVKAAWKKLFPLKAFSSFYQNDIAAEALQQNGSIATIFFWFAIISVLMSATGLFALISLTVLKKNREIAIRKVVGAHAAHVYKLVVKGYVFVFVLGAAFGCYAGYTLSKLLMDMIFKINAGVSVSSLAVSFACMLLIITATVSSRIFFVWRTKPTDVLKRD